MFRSTRWPLTSSYRTATSSGRFRNSSGVTAAAVDSVVLIADRLAVRRPEVYHNLLREIPVRVQVARAGLDAAEVPLQGFAGYLHLNLAEVVCGIRGGLG